MMCVPGPVARPVQVKVLPFSVAASPEPAVCTPVPDPVQPAGLPSFIGSTPVPLVSLYVSRRRSVQKVFDRSDERRRSDDGAVSHIRDDYGLRRGQAFLLLRNQLLVPRAGLFAGGE